ncbi:MAG: ATP-binding protein [Gemmatimonadaceae bacterium]
MSDAANVAEAELVFEARREHLVELLAFVDRACVRAGLDQSAHFDVRLAVEEAVTNVIDHGYAGIAGPVTVRFRRDPGQVVVTVEDLARRFDPSLVERVDPATPLEQRRIGGLGWHLINKVMDEVRLEHGSTHGNRMTLVKRIPTPT